MSTVTLIIILLGLAATGIFVAGFARGLRQSISGRDAASDTSAPEDSQSLAQRHFRGDRVRGGDLGGRVYPAAVYAGPFLVILTAAANGIAFFLDDGTSRVAEKFTTAQQL